MSIHCEVRDGIGLVTASAESFLTRGGAAQRTLATFESWFLGMPEIRSIVLDLDAVLVPDPEITSYIIRMLELVNLRGGKLVLVRARSSTEVLLQLTRIGGLVPYFGSIDEGLMCAAAPLVSQALARACRVESLERRGFKVVILRLTGDGYFSNTMEGLGALAQEHAPGIGSAGEVTHFLLLDLANVGLISERFSGFMLMPIRANAPRDADGKIRRFVPAVALIDPSKRHQSAFECLRFHRVLGYFADEAAACAAMTPHGFINLLPYAGLEKDASARPADHNAIGGHTIMPPVLARQTLDDLKKRGALGGFGPPNVMDSMDEILTAAQHHGDWPLYFETQWHICHILSAENDTHGLYNAADRGLRQARLLGDLQQQKCFQNLLNHASHRG